MTDVTVPGRASGDFERYGLLAALTLVILCLLLADRLRSSRPAVTAPAADRMVRVQIGGYDSRPAPAAPPRAAAAAPQRAAGAPAVPVASSRTAPAPVPVPAVQRTCVVGSGETLGDIAKRELGSARRAREIAELNGLASVDQVRAGQTLRLPPR
jgi:nucleoid-associated protein YgaU